ncbi:MULTISPECIES: BON domain-containing protein [Pseudomonadaceae]|uniref:Phospholipid-binding protein n=1 Tax=Pseudomonas abyssi TaxID=170540 RepID=A0A395R7R1_9PSED|nr:BON domain-containing protein [Halopseudomonas gallaeciensis]MAG66655.1 phospholipid-binding protein [Pseudomonadales bacterium]RGP56141.1 phospholipid-binding protein [Halopseudomonas gallaeciensis]|tara:strand:- start:892 stop:1458 length:567 start_codon:yes stop_codon:yes gene_type:complete
MIRASVIALSLLLASCSSVLTATRDTPIEDNHGTRTFGSTIDDQLIETKVAVNVNKADTAIESDGRIVATSYNGVVLLAGQVPRGDLIARAGEAAKQVQRVKVVHNELTAGPRLSLLARNQDGLITANLKTRLLTDGTIPGSRIKVVTEAGVVYLMGLVTHQEADLAVQQAQQIGGVQRIVKLFEYLD